VLILSGAILVLGSVATTAALTDRPKHEATAPKREETTSTMAPVPTTTTTFTATVPPTTVARRNVVVQLFDLAALAHASEFSVSPEPPPAVEWSPWAIDFCRFVGGVVLPAEPGVMAPSECSLPLGTDYNPTHAWVKWLSRHPELSAPSAGLEECGAALDHDPFPVPPGWEVCA